MKRNITLTLLLATFTLSLVFGLSNAASADCTVAIYRDTNRQVEIFARTLIPGEFVQANFPSIASNVASSVRITGNSTLILFQNPNFSVKEKIYERRVGNLNVNSLAGVTWDDGTGNVNDNVESFQFFCHSVSFDDIGNNLTLDFGDLYVSDRDGAGAENGTKNVKEFTITNNNDFLQSINGTIDLRNLPSYVEVSIPMSVDHKGCSGR